MWGNGKGTHLRREEQSEGEKDMWEFLRVWIGGGEVRVGVGWGGGGSWGAIRSGRWFHADSVCILHASSYPNGSSFIWSCWKTNHKSKKKYTSAHSKNPSRAPLPAYWVGSTRRGRGVGGQLSLSMMCCLLSQHVCDRKKRRKEGWKGGSREKKSLQCESTV